MSSNHKARVPAGKQRGSVRGYLRSHIEKRTFGELIIIGKGIAVALLTVIPTVLAVIVIANAIHDNGVVMTYLRVPQSFETTGFSSEIAYNEALRLNRSNFIGYRGLASLYTALGRSKEASEVIFNGATLLPQSAVLQFDYAEDLRKNGKLREALGPLRKAHELQPDNLNFAVALAEMELIEGRETEARRLASIVKSRLRNGEKIPPSFKTRSDALIARLEAKITLE